MAAPHSMLVPADASEVLEYTGGTWVASPSFAHEVRALGVALAGYGLGNGPVAVLGGSEAATLRADLAVLAAGGTLMPLDPDLSDDTLRHCLAAHGASIAIVADETRLARVLALRPDLPALDLLLVGAVKPSERKPAALLVDSAIAAGAAELTADAGILERQDADPTACLIADQEPVRRFSREVLARSIDTVASATGVRERSALLLSLPRAGLDRLAAVLAVLSRGGTLLLGDGSDRPDAGAEQRRPDLILLDPASLTRLHTAWQKDIAAKPLFKRAITEWALRQRGRTQPASGWRLRLSEQLVLRALRAKLGGAVTRLDMLGDPTAGSIAESEAFFASLGIPVRLLELANESLAR